MQFPQTLSFQGRQVRRSGKGRSPGSVVYMDVTNGRAMEMYCGRVVQTGNQFSLVQADDNRGLPAIRVDHSLLSHSDHVSRGDSMIVGPLKFRKAGPQAEAAWKRNGNQGSGESGSAPRSRPSRPASQNSHRHDRSESRQRADRSLRRFGVIGQVAESGTYGRIIDSDGNLVFVHVNQMRSGQMRIGQQVSFVQGDDGRGPKAFDVLAA